MMELADATSATRWSPLRWQLQGGRQSRLRVRDKGPEIKGDEFSELRTLLEWAEETASPEDEQGPLVGLADSTLGGRGTHDGDVTRRRGDKSASSTGNVSCGDG